MWSSCPVTTSSTPVSGSRRASASSSRPAPPPRGSFRAFPDETRASGSAGENGASPGGDLLAHGEELAEEEVVGALHQSQPSVRELPPRDVHRRRGAILVAGPGHD